MTQSFKREVEHLLAGELTVDYLNDILQCCQSTYSSSENYDSTIGGLRDDIYLNNILPYGEILNLMRGVYTPDIYEVSVLATVTNSDFYNDRHTNIQTALKYGNYTSAEKNTILQKDSQLSIPFTFDYSDGWDTLLTRSFSTVFFLISIVVCIIISPVFANEYQTGADAFILASKYENMASSAFRNYYQLHCNASSYGICDANICNLQNFLCCPNNQCIMYSDAVVFTCQ